MKIRRSYLIIVAATVLLPFAATVYRIAQSRPVMRTYQAQGIRRVVLRCSEVDRARVKNSADGKITVAGVPSGGVVGYHTTDPSWRPTKARDWGMDFVSKRYGDTLVISGKHETAVVHHHYYLADVILQVPASIEVQKAYRDPLNYAEFDLTLPNSKSLH